MRTGLRPDDSPRVSGSSRLHRSANSQVIRVPRRVEAPEGGARRRLDPSSPLTESNRGPSPYHGDALPSELRGRRWDRIIETQGPGARTGRGGSNEGESGVGTGVRRKWRDVPEGPAGARSRAVVGRRRRDHGRADGRVRHEPAGDEVRPAGDQAGRRFRWGPSAPAHRCGHRSLRGLGDRRSRRRRGRSRKSTGEPPGDLRDGRSCPRQRVPFR